MIGPSLVTASRTAALMVVIATAGACTAKPSPDPATTDAPATDAAPTAAGTTDTAATSPGGPASGLPVPLRTDSAKTPVVSAPPVVLAERCGSLRCQSFERGATAVMHIIPPHALIVAFGEAHAQRDAADVAPATERFHHQLLPKLAPRSSDLVLELVKPDGSCKTTAKQVASAQKPVVNRQADTNQNDFLALGHASQALDVRPHVLRPTCSQLATVQAGGAESVERLLALIATLTSDLSRRILVRNKRKGVEKTVLTYGGALHNDLVPGAGRERWTFGPELKSFTKGRYVAIDLIVPEYIKDTDTWKKLPWVAHYDATKMADRVWVFETDPGSYTVVLRGGVKSQKSPKKPQVDSP